MQTEFSPSLTRLDAMLWFLRVQMWLSVIGLITSFIQPFLFFSALSSLQNFVAFGIPILALLLFPTALATSALGHDADKPVASLLDLRSLVLRCVGLALFTQTLGWAVIYSFYVLYSFLPFVPSVSSAWLFGSGTAGSYYIRFQIVGTALRFLLGFFLAFGPTIRDNFRAR